MVSHSLLSLGAANGTEREENDFYATEPLAADLLVKSEPTLTKTIWECACGNGHLANRFNELGFTTINSDLVIRKFNCFQCDFLNYNEPINCDIATNPPYDIAEDFIRHSLDILNDGYKCCMFLKVQFFESEKRDELFEKYPPVRIHVCRKRIKCAKNGDFSVVKASPTCYAWFVWEKNKYDSPMIIDRV